MSRNLRKIFTQRVLSYAIGIPSLGYILSHSDWKTVLASFMFALGAVIYTGAE